MEMATGYERTQFIGVDLIPMFPTEIKPHNLNFQQYEDYHLMMMNLI